MRDMSWQLMVMKCRGKLRAESCVINLTGLQAAGKGSLGFDSLQGEVSYILHSSETICKAQPASCLTRSSDCCPGDDASVL